MMQRDNTPQNPSYLPENLCNELIISTSIKEWVSLSDHYRWIGVVMHVIYPFVTGQRQTLTK